MKKPKSVLLLLTIITICFLLAIAFDLSPFLRGPAPYVPDWRWAYLYSNTLSRILPAMLCVGGILFLFYKTDRSKNLSPRFEKSVLALLVTFSFLFQMSVLYFSRAGIGVLVHRIINTDLNGYFTVASTVTDIPTFLRTYETIVLSLPGHTHGHPPGAVLFFNLLFAIASLLPVLQTIVSHLQPTHSDVTGFWMVLTPAQKSTAIISPFLITFLSTLTILPLYASTKLVYGTQTALRSAFLYVFIPNIVFFLPLNDAFLPLLTACALYSLLRGIQSNHWLPYLITGAIFALGLFLSLSLLPVFVILGLYLILSLWKKRNAIMRGMLWIGGGLAIPYVLLWMFFQYNVLTVSATIMTGMPEHRKYLTWLFYNPYDFFVFSGIAVSIAALANIKAIYLSFRKKSYKQLPLFPFCFFLVLFLLNLSGSVRGEVGRIWLPFAPFMALSAAYFLTRGLRFSTKYMLLFLLLQVLQILVMQEVWVMLW